MSDDSDNTSNSAGPKPDASSADAAGTGSDDSTFGSTHDYDATASASLSDSPVAPEPGAIGGPGTGPGWNIYSGVGNGPGWSDQPTYPPTGSSSTEHFGEGNRFEPAQQIYGGHNYIEPGQPRYGGPAHGDRVVGDEALSDKSRTTAGLLQILLGFLGICGIGRLYLGSTGIGLAQLLIFLFGVATTFLLIGFVVAPVIWIWAFVDGVMMLTGTVRDPQGRRLRG